MAVIARTVAFDQTAALLHYGGQPPVSMSKNNCKVTQSDKESKLAASKVVCAHVSSLPGQWSAVEMEFLSPSKGWFPLWILAPSRRSPFSAQDGIMPKPLSNAAWQHASTLAGQALECAHQQTILLEGQQHLSVHGDVRMVNIIAHIGAAHAVDQVVFVDFDWAGLQGITRYALS